MSESGLAPMIEKKDARDLYQELVQVPVFSQIRPEDLECLGEVDLITAEAGTELIRQDDERHAYWVILSGEVRGEKVLPNGERTKFTIFTSGETFGEIPMLAVRKAKVICTVTQLTRMVRFKEDTFWKLMSQCPMVRRAVLGTMAERLQAYQEQAVHREKLIALGTLAAGLMHELNNPGAAATRAASQMRENLTRLQELSLRFCAVPLSSPQLECLRDLQDEAFTSARPAAVSSLEEADAEEALLEWLEAAGVDNAWKISPTLSGSGLDAASLECARSVFDRPKLSDALNWMGALVSSVQLLGTIEESISRVSSLVMAVKKFSRPDEVVSHELDVHDNIQSALTILAHKFRLKELRVEKDFAAASAKLTTRGSGLGQVWTNILDNAIDASPQKGIVTIRTWNEGGKLSVAIADRGAGIPKENWTQIFEPFFTTKPVGEGTGLGLDIAHRIVSEQYGGEITFDSSPQGTEFKVKLPIGG
jgi:signal transduction histidine kinase